jgi:DNA-binding NarL/FixJ family response regulator
MTSIRVVVVDDMKTIAREIKDCLEMEADITVEGIAFNGLEAIDLVAGTLPDVVLMDLEMPVMGGLDAIRWIRREMPSIQIIVLTVQEDGASLFEALKAGAKGYQLKNAPPEKITEAIRSVVGGNSAIPPALVETMCLEFDRIAQQAPAILNLFDKLTQAEMRALKCIGESKTNPQIARELFITEQAAKNYVTNILRKLEVNNRVEAAYMARTSGLSKGR